MACFAMGCSGRIAAPFFHGFSLPYSPRPFLCREGLFDAGRRRLQPFGKLAHLDVEAVGYFAEVFDTDVSPSVFDID